MPSLLAIETSSEACSVALQLGGSALQRYQHAPLKHAELLLPMVQSVLQEAGVALGSLDAVVYSRGPGSFTSLRIGLGVVQGLAWGADLPVVPLSSLAVVAQGVSAGSDLSVLVAMDARMDEVFHGVFRRNSEGALEGVGQEAVTPPGLLALSDPGRTLGAGTAFGRYVELEPLSARLAGVFPGRLPSAADMLPLARDWLRHNAPMPAASAQAVYLRDRVAEKPSPANRPT